MESPACIMKVVHTEWVTRDRRTVPESEPLQLVYPHCVKNASKEIHDILLANGIDIDHTSMTNDRVDIVQVIDNRRSILAPGTFIVIGDDKQVSVVYGAKSVAFAPPFEGQTNRSLSVEF